ncbi:hypothetical protein NFHSH190041_06910 [Shewanella sp. NFH-SH190041]|uniref:hypothetical protein n=1 Tax=Shewanella sp. NFH-SH190041 TaxID=2950245 RepID=UPI0021C3CDDD|nr:hypothetical protein [Shewanella sp. NFH-SH190041]BDM63239.1 hypothetical protein NFHSH190041_06910 [Shewanella sp. NFH-SH190041]
MSVSKIDAAYVFYKTHIFKPDLFEMLTSHGLKVPGSVPSVLWELFGSLLTGCNGAGNIGADLQGWEVKSSTEGSSYEYQYHLNTGLKKLHEDCEVSHLFCSYARDYSSVEVRVIAGKDLADSYFNNWIAGYLKNYDRQADGASRKQRYRKSIPYGYVQKNGIVVLRIEECEMVYKCEEALNRFNSRVIIIKDQVTTPIHS